MPDNDRMPATSTSAADPEAPRLGLRERKKIKTRQAIRRAAYDLIRKQGYETTTIEQIAEAAEVSPSTVFRYFPTKEDIVLTDGYNPILETVLRSRPADEPVLTSLRIALRQALAEERDELILRTELMAKVPAVRARMLESLSVTGRAFRRMLADRTGRKADDLEVRIFATGLFAALQEAAVYWAEHGHQNDIRDLVDRTLDTFQHGFEHPVDF
jgi:AcrR family transcriptional regulator